MLLALALSALALASPGRSQTPAPASSPAVAPPLRIERGTGFEPLLIPRLEHLDYTVEIDLGLFGDLRVGSVTLSSAVEASGGPPPHASAASPADPQEDGWIRSEARGSYMGYRLSQVIDVRHWPRDWPALLYTDVQTGSENRRHALRIGVRDGRRVMQFDEDHHCRGCTKPEHFVRSIWPWGKPYHCTGCKRMEHREWDVSITRPMPPGTMDLLSAVYLARSMVAAGMSTATFPVLDQDKLWDLTVHAGRKSVLEVPAGRFSCVLVELRTAVPKGEARDKNDFAGLFGIRGTIKIWMDVASGVPVEIAGDLPVPVLGRLGVNVRLTTYQGTPVEFAPVR